MKKFTMLFVLLGLACGDDDDHGDDGNEGEVITSVIMSFTPQSGGTAMVFEFDDADGDGGEPPTVEPISLAPDTYTLSITFENRLEEPAEDISAEVRDEGDEHMIFLLGSLVDGPANDNPNGPLMHSYSDQDVNGLPIGLENTIVATAAMGTLRVVLRHMPPVNGTDTKTAMTPENVSNGGLAIIGGENDIDIEFPVTVQ